MANRAESDSEEGERPLTEEEIIARREKAQAELEDLKASLASKNKSAQARVLQLMAEQEHAEENLMRKLEADKAAAEHQMNRRLAELGLLSTTTTALTSAGPETMTADGVDDGDAGDNAAKATSVVNHVDDSQQQLLNSLASTENAEQRKKELQAAEEAMERKKAEILQQLIMEEQARKNNQDE